MIKISLTYSGPLNFTGLTTQPPLEISVLNQNLYFIGPHMFVPYIQLFVSHIQLITLATRYSYLHLSLVITKIKEDVIVQHLPPQHSLKFYVLNQNLYFFGPLLLVSYILYNQHICKLQKIKICLRGAAPPNRPHCPCPQQTETFLLVGRQ